MDERAQRLAELLAKRQARELNEAGRRMLCADPGRALERFEQAVALVPAKAEYHHNCGVACLEAAVGSPLGRGPLEERAERAFHAAARLKPDFVAPVANLSGLLLRRREWDRTTGCVCDCMRHILQVPPAGEDVAWLASLALGDVLRCVERDPLVSQCISNVATALRMGGKTTEAVSVWRNWLGIRPPAREAGQEASASAEASTDQLVVVCVKWGTKYDNSYVIALARGMLQRGLSDREWRGEDPECSFLCLTDKPTELLEALPEDLLGVVRVGDLAGLDSSGVEWKGWWQKARLFSPEASCLLGTAATVLFCDLDVIVTGSLAPFVAAARASLERGDLVSLSTSRIACEARVDGVNSSVMVWRSGNPAVGHAFSLLHGAVFELVQRFDHWLEIVFDLTSSPTQLFPALVALEDAGVADFESFSSGHDALVAFPLQPKPHELSPDSAERRERMLARLFFNVEA